MAPGLLRTHVFFSSKSSDWIRKVCMWTTNTCWSKQNLRIVGNEGPITTGNRVLSSLLESWGLLQNVQGLPGAPSRPLAIEHVINAAYNRNPLHLQMKLDKSFENTSNSQHSLKMFKVLWSGSSICQRCSLQTTKSQKHATSKRASSILVQLGPCIPTIVFGDWLRFYGEICSNFWFVYYMFSSSRSEMFRKLVEKAVVHFQWNFNIGESINLLFANKRLLASENR